MTAAISQFFCLHRKYLLANLVLRNFRTRFRGSVLGYLWTLVIPISQIAVFYFVYQVVLKVPVPNYFAFIVTGIMPWVFFASTVSESLDTLVSGQNLITHLPVPIQVFPAATTVTNLISFMLSLPVIFGVLWWSDIRFGLEALWIVPLLMGLVLFSYSLSLILAVTFVLFRDLKYIFNIVLSLWIYATPVLYSMELVPESYRWIFVLNPLTGFFVGFRDALLHNNFAHPELVAMFFAWTAIVFVAANIVRSTLALRVVERL